MLENTPPFAPCKGPSHPRGENSGVRKAIRPKIRRTVNKHARTEAHGILAILGIALVAAILWVPPLAVLVAAAIAFVLYFFRDPDRQTQIDPDLALAPADGKVVAIRTMIESDYFQRRMVCITIFLSVFDVHVNRSPVEGKIIYSEGKKGKYLDARDPRSSRLNASRLWIFEGFKYQVGVRQITGAIARRIIPWSKVGDVLQQGDKFGMIRFGSRTELIVPEGCKILVRVGTSVRGGLTPMVQFPNATTPNSALTHEDISEGEIDPGL
jgi:phosphatidylserine decarboxylase